MSSRTAKWAAGLWIPMLWLGWGCAAGTPPQVDPRFDQVRARIAGLVEDGSLPSVAVAVAERGRIVWEEAFGWADRERETPATPHTIYPIGSMSKSITATALMTLVEKGAVRLSDPVSRHVGPLKSGHRAGAPTVRDVLTMTAGLPHGWMSFDYSPTAAAPRNRDLIDRYGLLVFPAGQFYEYSNYSYGVAELIVERAAGRPFGEFVEREVFKPLGMVNSGVWLVQPDSRVAVGYTDEGAPVTPYYFTPAGAAGMFASAHDLVRYGMFHLKVHLPDQQPILSDATLDAMHVNEHVTSPQQIIALGWGSVDLGDGLRWLITNGSINGANSMLTLIPSQGLAVVCLTNISSPESIADQLAIEIADAATPGLAAKIQTEMMRYQSTYEAPYAPSLDLAGEWRGTLQTSEGSVPVIMEFTPDSQVVIAVGGGPPVPVTGATRGPADFRGMFHTVVPVLGARGETTNALVLHVTRGVMTGYVGTRFSSPEGSFSLPSSLRLTRR